jgi:hypothetical protein
VSHLSANVATGGLQRRAFNVPKLLSAQQARNSNKRILAVSLKNSRGIMTKTDQTLFTVYVTIAAIALIGTWSQNIAFFRESGDASAIAFIKACFANHAAASISIDILLFGLAAFVFMGVEARRLGIRFLWLYIALSFLIAVSVMFPIFMAVRQRRLGSVR